MSLELLEDRGGTGIGFRILLPHRSHQEASQSLPLLLRQMGAQDPAGLGQQGVRVRGAGLTVGSLIGARPMVVRHVSVSRLLGRTACGLTCLSNRLTRQRLANWFVRSRRARKLSGSSGITAMATSFLACV